ncbi:MAG: enoyl-CoA hydratase/isomerase family protein [Ectothiorhodospiraceae bacterium]|nr:enoyl-CoA hydratase/isomerase family protein [Ectothiorhodospiraceae bacterium]
MTARPVLRVEREGAITRLTLDAPERRNALSAALVEAMLEALEAAGGDGTRLLVIRGDGKAFCAGFDFTGIDDQSDGDLVLRFVRVEQLLQALRHAPFATMALAHGAAFGAGADIVAACMHRVAAPGTRLRMPGLRFGVVLGTRRLADLIGTDAARGLLESTRVFDTDEALELGFLTGVADEQAWPALIDAAAAAATSLPPEAHRTLLARTVPDTRDTDMAALVASVATPGLADRIRAFLAK